MMLMMTMMIILTKIKVLGSTIRIVLFWFTIAENGYEEVEWGPLLFQLNVRLNVFGTPTTIRHIMQELIIKMQFVCTITDSYLAVSKLRIFLAKLQTGLFEIDPSDRQLKKKNLLTNLSSDFPWLVSVPPAKRRNVLLK